MTRDTYTGEEDEPESLHLYTYCYNNPVTFSDAGGDVPVSDIIAAGEKLYRNATKLLKKNKTSGKNKKRIERNPVKRDMKCGESTRSKEPSKLFRVDDLRIDTDGKVSKYMRNRKLYGDAECHDDTTAYFGDKIAADEIPYFVIPYESKEQKEQYGKYAWSVGVLIDFNTNNFIYGVVADNNDKRKNNTVGEISIYAAWNIKGQLKNKPSMNKIETEGEYGIILYAKSAAKGRWAVRKNQKPKILRQKIIKQGKKCFKGVGKCLNKK